LSDGGNSRPSARQSEIDVGSDLGSGADPQVSYKNGQQVPYGTSGSVRPDYVATDGTASFEVKNYNVATNSSGLINNVANQAIQRAANLPDGMEQQVVIDVRGQTMTPDQRTAIVQGIVQKSNGIIDPSNIQFKTQ
jgi:filamentous hemagglutinin